MAATSIITCSVQQVVDQIRFEEISSSGVRKVILNRPTKLNSINYEMVSKVLGAAEKYERDPAVSCIILKANGKAFSAGGDVISVICSSLGGHWSYPVLFYRKILMASYLLATFKKPVISLLQGIVIGGGAGLSIQTTFRIVTEKTIFSMPEASIGLFADVGASYFLSRLPGSFGEYLALTGARLDGPEMVACGLASHFVLYKDLNLLEKAICEQVSSSSNASHISEIIEKFAQTPNLKQDSAFKRLETVLNRCFSRSTVEEILASLENEVTRGGEKWIKDAHVSMTSASPTSLKVTLKSIREGRSRNLEQCLSREFFICGHMIQGMVNRDFYEIRPQFPGLQSILVR
ncbi:3-hydroxyisobutyryl-CoA hydrolase 1-like isoform X2 [Punica granatum]|uniref:3-hydroxyisobutyryl-CoA hydrolase n=1 Tax=Punica granatum TaxID=22663 RepID=A0A6P8CDE1_PUNGR|nr:3-hydroxyisobutyryl-CoA hydrolase 1-like isoform X2 [Punica granatum]